MQVKRRIGPKRTAGRDGLTCKQEAELRRLIAEVKPSRSAAVGERLELEDAHVSRGMFEQTDRVLLLTGGAEATARGRARLPGDLSANDPWHRALFGVARDGASLRKQPGERREGKGGTRLVSRRP
jgi:hypothetical protein